MRRSAPGLSPEKIALVADRPGSEPMTRPYTEAANIAMMTSQVEISANASMRVLSMGSPGRRQQASGERHAQQLAEDEVDGERRQRRERQCQLPLRPERGRGD